VVGQRGCSLCQPYNSIGCILTAVLKLGLNTVNLMCGPYPQGNCHDHATAGGGLHTVMRLQVPDEQRAHAAWRAGASVCAPLPPPPGLAQSHLCPAVDDINLVKADNVHNLLALLQLSLRALHKLGGGAWHQHTHKHATRLRQEISGSVVARIEARAAINVWLPSDVNR